eukprot:CAMPEP_0195335598 /NCGR_PEP_ID=MMETSP0708-20121125/15673_1 /TAXON_ID=33640 /ORGANISM="Asterionellopsis glacialis, Strain CCMP134" /LENGTH=41 /DNA_ID= /DNA_START= /DNA_END= /DNA_ORIENTATION=
MAMTSLSALKIFFWGGASLLTGYGATAPPIESSVGYGPTAG